jgi:hypothetical protein
VNQNLSQRRVNLYRHQKDTVTAGKDSQKAKLCLVIERFCDFNRLDSLSGQSTRAGHKAFVKPICRIYLGFEPANHFFAGVPAAVSGGNVDVAACPGIDELRLPRPSQF